MDDKDLSKDIQGSSFTQVTLITCQSIRATPNKTEQMGSKYIVKAFVWTMYRKKNDVSEMKWKFDITISTIIIRKLNIGNQRYISINGRYVI